jgi:hypothetical protein
MILNLNNKSMRVKCIYNTGKDLRQFELKEFHGNNEVGRFGATGNTLYNEIDIGEEYYVGGIIVSDSCVKYLIDSGGYVFSLPAYLFETIDDKFNENWSFCLVGKKHPLYPNVEVIIGYKELCNNTSHYNDLLEVDIEAQKIYFLRKIEIEKGK